MSGDADDEDHTTFIRLERCNGEGEEPVLSRAAFQLHSFAIVETVKEGHPGFVPDEYLNPSRPRRRSPWPNSAGRNVAAD